MNKLMIKWFFGGILILYTGCAIAGEIVKDTKRYTVEATLDKEDHSIVSFKLYNLTDEPIYFGQTALSDLDFIFSVVKRNGMPLLDGLSLLGNSGRYLEVLPHDFFETRKDFSYKYSDFDESLSKGDLIIFWRIEIREFTKENSPEIDFPYLKFGGFIDIPQTTKNENKFK